MCVKLNRLIENKRGLESKCAHQCGRAGCDGGGDLPGCGVGSFAGREARWACIQAIQV